jgi:hypothetical protein
MSAAPDAAPLPLSAPDAARLATLAGEILASPAPPRALLETLAALAQEQKLALAAALYESVCYRVPTQEYWLHFAMCNVYRRLGPARDDATFFHAAAGLRLLPDASGADQLYRDLFRILVRRGADRAALDLFRYQVMLRPDQPAATPHELAPVLHRLGEAASVPAPPRPPPDDAVWRLHDVLAEETLAPWTCPVFGGAPPYWLEQLTRPQRRPPIAVAEFTGAEVLIYRNAVVVLDRAGNVHEDCSVGEFTEPVRARVAALAARDAGAVPLHEADTAVLIADRFPAPNIGHFLFDQIARLAIYRRLGIPIEGTLVIGPEPALDAQRQILRRAGVGPYLGTDRIARVRARRLWVSSNCRALQHPAHLGAGWALDFMREILGGRYSTGWRRLYLSRRGASARQVVNEAEVMALLEPHGFEWISPAEMPYDAQLAAFRQASEIVSPHGAGLTHMVLLPPGARVLEIFHPLYGNSAYATLAAATGLNYAALLARDWDSDAPEWNDPASADEPGRFGDRFMRVPPETLSRYLATVA